MICVALKFSTPNKAKERERMENTIKQVVFDKLSISSLISMRNVQRRQCSFNQRERKRNASN